MDEDKAARHSLLRIRLVLVLLCVLVFSITPVGNRFFRQLFTDAGFDVRAENRDFALVRIHVLDVGKADAILLESQGHAALLDAGTYERGGSVVDYLCRQGITSLDYALVSHPDSDHVGGMMQVMKEIPTDTFMRGENWNEIGQEAEDLETYLAACQMPQRTLTVGDTFFLGHAGFEVLGPLEDYGDANNNSLVLKMTCSGFSALFCGDMEKEAERDLAASGQNLSADLLKVGHHGSRTSTTEEFVQAVSPRLAVVSVGEDNNNLPRTEPLETLEKAGAYILRTDLDGNLLFSWNGEKISVKKGS